MIHLIIGRQGSGKSLFCVHKAQEYYLSGSKVIYSNIHLNFKTKEKLFKYNHAGKLVKDYTYLKKDDFHAKFGYYYLDYDDIINCNLDNAMVVIDEAHLLLSARNSMSTTSRKICDSFISMVRKKKLELYMTTQTARKIDIRIREECDFLYMCSKYGYWTGSWHEIIDNLDRDKKIPIMIKIGVQEQIGSTWLNVNFIGNPIFSLFDSTQIIKVKGI